ncbi:MAG: PmoA family protein [Verrucomicrobiae bacterium]|nr:PmoA family protein [Verrucomicrobiae bacterium]
MNKITLPVLAAVVLAAPAFAGEAKIELRRWDGAGRMQFVIDGKPAIVYLYSQDLEMVHYFPVLSPSGKSLTIQKTQPYPHHRSFWFADTVEFEGRKISFYNAYYSGSDKKNPGPPFRDRIRHVEFLPDHISGQEAGTGMKIVWETEKTPVIDELRRMRVVALGQGEYFLDLHFTLAASHGDVKFVSDAVHYGWPFVRMHPAFTPAQGGTLTNSEGKAGQKDTCMLPARWVDYSNTVEGTTEGLAMFQHPDLQKSPKWLTRDYGTFGPRRTDEQSGKPFILRKGDRLRQRVGILVHTGNVKSGKVEARYQQYVAGKL